jgi:hypothetical protein
MYRAVCLPRDDLREPKALTSCDLGVSALKEVKAKQSGKLHDGTLMTCLKTKLHNKGGDPYWFRLLRKSV